MIRNIILQQKEEKEMLQGRPYLQRLHPVIHPDYLSSGLIKLVTGPRRSGKSVFALQLLKEYNFAYLNFDDDQLLNSFLEDDVSRILQEVYPDYTHLLLDEVQNLSGWEIWISKMYRMGINMIITGSNARLLSKEMATVLTGRYLQISVLPFSFEEYLSFYQTAVLPANELTPVKTGEILQNLDDYMRQGGFPETLPNRAVTRNYLSSLFDSVLLKDIANRFQVRQIRKLYDLAHYLLTNYCNLFTFSQLKTVLEFNSVATVLKYGGYLTGPYLFFYLPRYVLKLKTQQKTPQKIYVVDNGFIYCRSFELSQKKGRLLENLIFAELLRKGYQPGMELFYYRSRNDKEVDFLCRAGHKVSALIQVCFDISDMKTLKRELNALAESAQELGCSNLTILTWDQEKILEAQGMQIHVMPVWKWLLGLHII